MTGPYDLIIFICCLGLWSRHLKSYPLSIKDLGEKETSNTNMTFTKNGASQKRQLAKKYPKVICQRTDLGDF